MLTIKGFKYLFAAALLSLSLILNAQPASQPININQATAEQIAVVLKGVGLKKAEAIVEYREHYGPFVSVEQLTEVKGIGDRTIEENRAVITLE